MRPETLYFDTMDSPIGELRLLTDDFGLRRIRFAQERHPRPEDEAGIPAPARLASARRQLQEYFAGDRTRFDLTLRPIGTPFQQRVWQALAKIPYGATISYAELAQRIGQPQAMRAVGAANGRNPLPIVLPCHRVIGQDGRLVGFGGGLAVKAQLLALERGGASLSSSFGQ